MAVIHSKKMGKRHVYHFVTSPFLLIALSECLGIEDCPISPDTRQRLDSLWSSLSDSPFMMGLTFSIGDRSGLQAGTSILRCRASTKPLMCRMMPGIVLLPREDVILMAVYVSVGSQYTPPHQWCLHIYARMSGWSFLSLGLRSQSQFFPKTS